jgi:diketogulonate reductase-like aldo/keto reductase
MRPVCARPPSCFLTCASAPSVSASGTCGFGRLSENIDIFDFALSAEEMQQISQLASARGRLTDFGFAPKWD